MRMIKKILLTLILAAVPLAIHAAAWPASSTATDLGASLISASASFEPSGITWHGGRGTYIVVSDGSEVAELSTSGAIVNLWSVSGNWEGIAVADDSTSLVYLAHENNSAIYEFDLSTGSLTGNSWSIVSYVYPVGKSGFEALAFVPDGDHAYGTTASGGVFYAGWQYDGDIYIFEPNLSVSGSITYLGEISTHNGYTDLSGLDYNHDTDTLIAVYDGYDAMEIYDGTGAYTSGHSYTIPDSGAWEGVALQETCPTSTSGSIVLADDGGGLSAYGSFTAPCVVVDTDGDGIYSDTDCNDSDAAVSSNQTYYLDADGDGVGSSITTSVCSASAPSGYVTIAGDCSDTDASVSTDQTYYRDQDGDGYGDLATTVFVCSAVAPSGYVTNTIDLYPNNRIELCGDSTDNDGDRSIDEANTLAENGRHPLYSAMSASAAGYITGVSITSTADVRLTYADGSCFDYTIFTMKSGFTLSAVYGTSYYTAKRGGQTATLNGLTGEVTITGSLFSVSPKKHLDRRVKF